MSDEIEEMTGRIHHDFFKKTFLKILLRLISFGIILISVLYLSKSFLIIWFNIVLWTEFSIKIIIYGIFIPIMSILFYGIWYLNRFIADYRFTVTDTYIEIFLGVFTKKWVLIPFSRVQNINIIQGVLDRAYGLYTLEIETAGSPVTVGNSDRHPEGLIIGIKDPQIILKMLRSKIRTVSTHSTASSVDNILFTHKDLALDHFISIFLEKIKEGKDIKNIIKDIRTKKGLSQQDLADKVGTSRQTIIQLENKEYNPSLKLAFRLAKILDVKVEDLFEMLDADFSD